MDVDACLAAVQRMRMALRDVELKVEILEDAHVKREGVIRTCSKRVEGQACEQDSRLDLKEVEKVCLRSLNKINVDARAFGCVDGNAGRAGANDQKVKELEACLAAATSLAKDKHQHLEKERLVCQQKDACLGILQQKVQALHEGALASREHLRELKERVDKADEWIGEAKGKSAKTNETLQGLRGANSKLSNLVTLQAKALREYKAKLVRKEEEVQILSTAFDHNKRESAQTLLRMHNLSEMEKQTNAKLAEAYEHNSKLVLSLDVIKDLSKSLSDKNKREADVADKETQCDRVNTPAQADIGDENELEDEEVRDQPLKKLQAREDSAQDDIEMACNIHQGCNAMTEIVGQGSEECHEVSNRIAMATQRDECESLDSHEQISHEIALPPLFAVLIARTNPPSVDKNDHEEKLSGSPAGEKEFCMGAGIDDGERTKQQQIYGKSLSDAVPSSKPVAPGDLPDTYQDDSQPMTLQDANALLDQSLHEARKSGEGEAELINAIDDSNCSKNCTDQCKDAALREYANDVAVNEKISTVTADVGKNDDEENRAGPERKVQIGAGDGNREREGKEQAETASGVESEGLGAANETDAQMFDSDYHEATQGKPREMGDTSLDTLRQTIVVKQTTLPDSEIRSNSSETPAPEVPCCAPTIGSSSGSGKQVVLDSMAGGGDGIVSVCGNETPQPQGGCCSAEAAGIESPCLSTPHSLESMQSCLETSIGCNKTGSAVKLGVVSGIKRYLLHEGDDGSEHDQPLKKGKGHPQEDLASTT